MRCLSTTWLLNIVRLVNENILYYGDVFIVCPLKGGGYYEFGLSKVLTSKELFRPQKGLLVINVFPYFLKEVVCCGFPSPTGVTYYE